MAQQVDVQPWSFKSEGESDLHIMGPVEWTVFPGPWTCVDCVAGHKLEMNIFQLRDHVKLTHREQREDTVSDSFKSVLATIFQRWKDQVKNAARAKEEANA